MGRKKRIYYENAVYHVSIRGNNKQAILGQDEDKLDFLRVLSRFKERFKFKLFGFVLMHNHAHLVIGTNSNITISRVIQSITLSYSQKFRHKYNYTGYVWQGRFRSNIIANDGYITACLNYIHNNPVRANMVDSLGQYKWSSYHFYQGAPNECVDLLIDIDKVGSRI
jgi:putative transposase